MKKDDDIRYKKAKKFAIRIIKFSRFLKREKREFEIAKQIIRSGTSIGANIAEAQYAESNSDFVHKLRLALKESSETHYWLELLYESETIDKKIYLSLEADCQELIKMLTFIVNKKKE